MPSRRTQHNDLEGRAMGAVTDENSGLFEQAPPNALQRQAGLIRPNQLNVGRRAVLIVLIGWVPLVLLTLVAATTQGHEVITSLLRETGVHARYLFAAPLLILAERECASQLTAVVMRFVDSALVPDRSRPRLRSSINSTRTLLDSTIVEITIIVIAYLVVAAAIWSHPPDAIPVWHLWAG